MPTIAEIMGTRKKEIAEPILKHLFDSAADPIEAAMVLMLCLTEITARSIQSQNPNEIAARMKEFTEGWIDALTGEKDPSVPALLQ
jgi:hypothetical protein